LYGLLSFNQFDKKLKIIEANEFRVIDNMGKVLSTYGAREIKRDWSDILLLDKSPTENAAILDFYDNGYPTMTILKGHIVLDRGKITFKEFEPVFAELDHNGLDLYDYDGKKVVSYNQALSFYDNNGAVRFTAEINNDGNPYLQLYDKSKNLRAVLGHTLLSNHSTGSTEIRAESSLVLFNEKGNVLWSAP